METVICYLLSETQKRFWKLSTVTLEREMEGK